MTRLAIAAMTGILVLGAAACTTSPESDPAYISPTHYSSYDCRQLDAENKRVSTKLEHMADNRGNDTTGKLVDAAVAAFAISQGYGFDDGDDDVAYRRLRNQYDVLEQTTIEKGCFE